MAGGDASAHTLQTWLAVIDGIRARGDVQPVLRKLHQAGFAILFQYAGKPDPAVRTRFRGQIDQGTFGARRIYLDQAPRSTRSAPRTPRGSSPCSRGPVRRPTRTPCSTSRASSPARRAMVGHAAGDPLHV